MSGETSVNYSHVTLTGSQSVTDAPKTQFIIFVIITQKRGIYQQLLNIEHLMFQSYYFCLLLRCELAMLPVERPHCWGIVLLITLVDGAQQRRQLSTKALLSSLVKKKKRRASSSALRKMLRGQYGLWVNRKALKKTFHVLGKLSKIKCIAEDYVGWWPSRLNDDINW